MLAKIKTLAGAEPFTLVIIDTFAAFFDGNDTNDATQGGEFMRRLRPLTKIGGLPTVLVAAHPIKNAPEDNLLPYGSGAILNEVDGNLTLWKQPMREVVDAIANSVETRDAAAEKSGFGNGNAVARARAKVNFGHTDAACVLSSTMTMAIDLHAAPAADEWIRLCGLTLPSFDGLSIEAALRLAHLDDKSIRHLAAEVL